MRQRLWGRYCFIHINKCAGTSVEQALGIPVRIHDTARHRRRRVGARRWARMFKFAVVRHPYGRACSHYWYRYRRNLHGMADRGIGLNEWIVRAYGNHELPYYNNELMFAPCWHWLVDDRNQLLIDHVAHLESIDADWPTILQGCGVNAQLPVTNRASQGGSEELDDRSRKILQAHFADDFGFLGYSE